MTPAVANLALAKGTAYDVALVIQDAAAQPIDLTGCILAASIMSAPSPVDLAVTVTDAAAGLATVHIPAQPLGMVDWELWMQATPDTPRERILRGLVTVADRVDPRDEGNPSSHRLIVRISDAVTVTVDSVDLAWWAYEQTRKLLGVDYATLAAGSAREAAQSAATSQASAQGAHTSSVNAATYATEAMRYRDAAGLSASSAATFERNADASAQASALAARTASDAQEAGEAHAQELRRLLDGFDLVAGVVDSVPYGSAPEVSITPGPTPGSHVLNFVLVTGPKGEKGDPGTLTANAGDVDINGRLTATSGTINGPLKVLNTGTTVADINYIYGLTWMIDQVELRRGAVVRDDLWVETGVIRIGSRAQLVATGPVTVQTLTASQCINANGGINIPLAIGAATDTAATTRAARQAVRDSFQSMLDRTQSQGFWGKAKRSINPPVIRDNKATIDVTHIGVRLQWLGGTVKPSGRKSEVTGRRIKSLLIPFRDSPLRRRSLASLHIPEEEVMVLGDVDTGSAILARVKQRKRRNKDGHYQDVTPLGALVKSATIPAHPEVMPSREQMREYAVHAATLVLNRLLDQKNQAGNS